jgi:cellulose synthase/poly-beta-1,6-N-acetylglucosamine synthase-like glycosyltransferase
MTVVFFIFLGIVIYAYLLYPVLIWALASIKCWFEKPIHTTNNTLPRITLLVAAYNEENHVDEKVKNSIALNYPKDKLKLVWITDGSTDNTNQLLKQYPEVELHYSPERRGKIHAMNRGMKLINSEVVVFSDGNTLLGENTLLEIARLFSNPKIGCIAGEKRVFIDKKDGAAAAGEGIYWKYESFIKKQDARFGSTIGAAGELFAVRKALFKPVEPDTILDDFMISLRIAAKGYKIGYSPEAYAIEKASANVGEEMKRKIRIAAGSFQSIGRLAFLFNLFRYPKLSFQFISHKVLRWIGVPLALPTLVILNTILFLQDYSPFWLSILIAQLAAYTLAVLGYLLQDKKIAPKILFVPYYFLAANWAQWLGFFRHMKGQQSVNWERAKRAE